MLDLRGCSYLGLRHGSVALGRWPALTTQRPAVLGGAVEADAAARAVAGLQGLGDGLAGPSTLHLAVDLFAVGLPADAVLYRDAHLYPILRNALRVAGKASVAVPPHDPAALATRLRGTRHCPVMVTDGWCIDCGCAAPLAEYVALLRQLHGLLVVDDTQALGLFGTPGAGPFGQGGGGTLRAQALGEADPVVAVTSLAKAFAAPMAVLAGPTAVLDRVRAAGPMRIHASPPSVPVARAALRALRLNRACGTRRRAQLTRSLRLFRASCRNRGVWPAGGFHPVQTVTLPPGADVADLLRRATRQGVKLAASRIADGSTALRFVVTTGHAADVCWVASVLAGLTRLAQTNAATGKSNQGGT
jgi:8-amino-7-oxononanoate synthase